MSRCSKWNYGTFQYLIQMFQIWCGNKRIKSCRMNIITKTWLRERDLISHEAKSKWDVEKKCNKDLIFWVFKIRWELTASPHKPPCRASPPRFPFRWWICHSFVATLSKHIHLDKYWKLVSHLMKLPETFQILCWHLARCCKTCGKRLWALFIWHTFQVETQDGTCG